MGVPRPPGHGGKGITPRTDVGISDHSLDTMGLLLLNKSHRSTWTRGCIVTPWVSSLPWRWVSALLVISSVAWGKLLNLNLRFL